MAQITVTIPDEAIALYNQRRATLNDHLTKQGQPTLPPLFTPAIFTRFLLRWMQGQIEVESQRLDPGDGSVLEADDAITKSW